MENQKDPPSEVGEAACGACTVHHLVFPAVRKEKTSRPPPLSDAELLAIRKVFQMCPVARRCSEESKT